MEWYSCHLAESKGICAEGQEHPMNIGKTTNNKNGINFGNGNIICNGGSSDNIYAAGD
jgi:hypothetical protein